MSDKPHNPKSHQSPVHDDRAAKPGLGALAPEDQDWQPTPHPTAPGEEPTAPGSMKAPDTTNEKLDALEKQRKGGENAALTTNQGLRIADDQNSLRAGQRGPTLLEDFILREKITHFDHERIPERIVHARGSAAHGYFQAYSDLSDITKAAFLCDPQKKRRYSSVFPPFRAALAPPIRCATSAVLPPSFIPTRVSLTWSATTRRSFLSRMRSSFPILSMR